MTAAAPVSIASARNCWAAGPPAMFHRQYSAAHSRQPSAASSASAAGTRRLTAYSRASRSQATPGRAAAGAGTAPGG